MDAVDEEGDTAEQGKEEDADDEAQDEAQEETFMKV
jgi:hypothetical protein